MRSLSALRAALQVGLVVLPLSSIGCAGEATTPGGAAGPGQPGGPGAVGPTGIPGGPGAAAPVYGMSDTPSSGAAGERPKMNDEAAGYYQQGMSLFVRGDLKNAKAQFVQATKADPRAHQAYYSLGVVQERLEDSGAASSYRQSYKLVPDYEPAILAYAMYKAKKGGLSDAESFLKKKKAQMPKSAAVTATLGEIKSLQGDTGSAQQLAQEALKLNPDYRPAMVIIARDHYRHRRLDLALYAIKAILDGFEPVAENPPRDKDNAEALLLRGLIYKEQGHRADALDQFKRAVQRRPDLVEARVQLATLLLEAGDANQALPLLEGAVLFDNRHLPAHLNLGDAYRLLGRYPEAKTQFDWVMKKDKSLPQVHYNLGLLYLFAPSVPGMTPMQQIKAAMASLKKYQDLRPKGIKDDSEELLQRAKLKKGELEAQAAAAAPPPPAGGGK